MNYLGKMISGFAAMAFCLACGAAETNDAVNFDSDEMFFSGPSLRCTLYNPVKDRMESCAKEQTDCVKISRRGQGRFDVELFSTQANGHICAIKGVATLSDKKLVLPLRGDTVQSLEIKVTGAQLKTRLVNEKKGKLAGCGAHATPEGLVLLKNPSVPHGTECFSE